MSLLFADNRCIQTGAVAPRGVRCYTTGKKARGSAGLEWPVPY